MVYWHVETDYVAMIIYIVLLIKAALLNKEKDFTDKMFSLALILGIISTGIDIYSSVMMNDRLSWWSYEISMIIYGLSVPVLPLFWFLYTVSLIFVEKKTTARRFVIGFYILYAIYAVVIITNPVHELYFHLTQDIVYSRGNWFLPLIVGSQTFLSAVGILLLLFNRKKLRETYIFFLLVFLYLVTAASYYVQIANPGWLIICSTYALAFLVCDATFESRRRDNLYRTIKQSVEQLQEDKEKELAYQKKLEEAADEAMRANLAKSDFLARMSHDIRTPINGIVGMMEIIEKERRDDARVDDCLQKIKVSSKNLLSLINDVLDMSKLESGEIVLTKEPFNICEIVADVVSVLSQMAVDNGIRLIDDSPEREVKHPYLIGSPLHVRQIIVNIVGNAIKYNIVNGEVRCSFEEIISNGEQVVYRFVVRDTGIGISREFLPILFQPFSQEHAGSRSQYEGTGLGLAIVKKVVDNMGGEIHVESEVGEGSVFSVTLPFVIDANPPVQPAAKEESDTDSLAGTHVLLVEDNELNMEIAKFILEEYGAVVDTAENGQEALEKFAESGLYTYGAVLMDIMMPVMNGLEASEALRAMEREDAKNVPIIAMTANAFPEDRQKCHDAGMNDHLAKPLDSAKLIKTLSGYMGHHAKEMW